MSQAIDVEPANAKAHRCKAEVLLWMCNFAESVAAYDAGMQKCADPEGLAEGRQTAERAQQLIRQCQVLRWGGGDGEGGVGGADGRTGGGLRWGGGDGAQLFK